MGCYYGCETGSNRCAWFWYLILLIAGVGALGYWGARNGACVSDASTCADSFNLTQASGGTTPAINTGTDALSARAFCEELYGPSGAQLTTPSGLSPIDGCVVCVQQLQGCVEPTLPILYAGVALLLLTLLPCMYCCCCSNKPDPAARYY